MINITWPLNKQRDFSPIFAPWDILQLTVGRDVM